MGMAKKKRTVGVSKKVRRKTMTKTGGASKPPRRKGESTADYNARVGTPPSQRPGPKTRYRNPTGRRKGSVPSQT